MFKREARGKLEISSPFYGFDKKYPMLYFGRYHTCLIDYLFMVRRQTENIFNAAKDEMKKTCSETKRNRKRIPTGDYHFIFFCSSIFVLF